MACLRFHNFHNKRKIAMRFLPFRSSLNFLRNNVQRINRASNFSENVVIVHRGLSSSTVSASSTTVVDNESANTKQRKIGLSKGPSLKDFLVAGKNLPANGDVVSTAAAVPYLNVIDYNGHGRKVFFEVYGCQMNVNDTEVVWAILKDNGYEKVETVDDADVVLVITCAIREKAESKVNYFYISRKVSTKLIKFNFRFGTG